MSRNKDKDPFIEISRILPLLPYADQLDAYADTAANGLKESLMRLISSSTYLSHLSQFPDFIHKYIVHFGMRFTKKELIDIIKFGLAIAFCPQVDEVNRSKWKQCVSLLLALSHNYIKKEELQLEWKTFQNAFMRITNEFGICNYTYKIKPLDSVLIDKANRYFTSSCVQEIWESERSRIYTSLSTESFQGIFDYLQKFTPNELSNFEEIKQIWLEEIFHMWYQYPTPEFHVAVVKLLAKYSRHFTGRLDMEPHLDRIFNFLITFIYDKNTDRVALTSSAELIVNSIVPTSNVFNILRNFLKVCALDFRLDKEEAAKVNLPFFCSQLTFLFCKRFNFEFTWIAEMREHIGEVVEWARLTKEQVDEFVEILLPICFEDAFFIEDKCSICDAIQTLALLRPQNVIPRVIESLEEASLTPQIPLKLIKSLKFLASCSTLFCRPNVFPIWNHYIGFQPTDQLQNFPLDNQTDPHKKTPEQRRQWDSSFSAMIYPELRMQVPKVLDICLKVLNLDQEYYIHDSIYTLSNIFMNMPIKYILGINSSSSISKVEDLILLIFRKIFKVMGRQNRLNQDLIDNGHVVVQPPNIVHDLSLLAIYIAMSANSMPKQRVRLLHAFLIIILHTPWTPAVFSKFPDILIWLLSGPLVDGTDLSESDTALHALHKVWPLFLRLYGALKAGKCFSRDDQVDITLIHLLNILQAFFVVFVPSRTEEVMTNFIDPVIDILFDLCNASLGYGGSRPPSIDLAKYASECLGVLLYRLLTISVDFKGVDLFNSAECTTNPHWTPFVGYQKAKDLVKWCLPTKRTFSIAQRIIKKFLIPILRNLGGITNELSAYVENENIKKIRVPHITIHSQQPGITNQRLYLISLITWIGNICTSIFEGLKPRNIRSEDLNCIGKICSELELLRHENVACQQIGLDSREFKPDLDFFDFPSFQDKSTLRDQIFRYGLRFLDVLAKLSMKFDKQTIGSRGKSMIERILDPKQLNLFFKVVAYAGFNYVEYTKDEACKFNTHPQIPIKTYCLGFYRDYIEPEDDLCGKIGPSSELLACLTRGETSSLRLGGDGGIYGASYLPIVWLMCARRQYFNFIRRAIGLNAVWEGTEALSLFTNPRLPANRELNRLVESSLRIALNCSNIYLEEFAVNIHYLTSNEVPGMTTTLTRLFVDFMKSCFESDIFAKSDAEYRTLIFRLKRVIRIIYLLVTKTAFSIELYNNDPTLWSEMWAILLRLCMRSSFPHARLTSGKLQERVNDQDQIFEICLHAMNTLETHQFTLYFHASYELEAHSKDSPLRHLIHSAQKLLITLGGCKETIVKFRPLLLVKTAKLRRDAHKYLIQVIDEESMKNDNLDSKSVYLILKLLSINFQVDLWNTHFVYASFPDVELVHKIAPPPPIPSLSTIKKALALMSSENNDISFAASRFVVNFLLEWYLRARDRKYVCIDWRSVEIPRKCEGLENECQYDCLSSKNYTLRNHILSLINSPNYFQSTSVWMDPYSFAVFPTFSGFHENVLQVDPCNKEWLKFRSDIDLSELTRKEVLSWQNGIKIIAEFFASPASWIQMSQFLLNSSRPISKYLIEALKILIQFILLGFGPHPYLQRVEDFIMSLLQPALMQNAKNEFQKHVGTSLVNEILYHVAVGSFSWPRGMKLELYGRVLPRLILYAEAAPQCPSKSVGFNINPLIPLGLSNASLAQPTKCDADIADANESNSSSQEETEASPANSRLADAIRFGDWENDETHCFQEEDIPAYCGQCTQICSPIFKFLRKFSAESIEFAYLPYIWKSIGKLASVGNLSHFSEVGDPECGHGIPGDNGVCPVCAGCRLFPRVDQRRALKEKMMVGLLTVTHWDTVHLIKHFTDMGMEPWEKMVCRNSLSSRQQAMAMSYSFARADYNRIRNTAPPTIRFYKNGGDAPVFYQHLYESPLVTELIYPLTEFEVPELKAMSLIGPDFIMKRYLPLLVRDVMADLLLKGVRPSEASFALQDDLLSKAPEKITPATEKIMKFSQHTKHTLEKEITPRILQMLEFLTKSVWSVYPINVLPNTSFDSVFDVLCRLAPLLADCIPIMKSDKDNSSLGTQISNLLTPIYNSTIIGHTNADLEINQADRMLEFLDAFLLHESHQTRDYGLQMMKMIRIHYSTFWKRNDAVDVLRCRLKQGLCNLLKDSSIDVAEAASKRLSWALECEIIEYDEEWVSELKEQSRATNQTGTEEEREAMLRNQRAGVLGLYSIIRAHPSSVPDYLPDVIAEVAKHATDPHPIGQMITTTMNEYYLNVFKFLPSEDRRKFSSKQIEVIESFIARDCKHT
nr:Proteasome activator complex subunit 4 [Hymenolepis microstoma]